MSPLRRWVTASLGGLVATASAAAEVPEVRRLFPHQAEVRIERDGLSRLVLPAEVLAACRPDLSDLRLFDRQEREVAFLVDRGDGPSETAEITWSVTPPVLDLERAESRPPGRSPLWEEHVVLGLPDEARRNRPWVLVVSDARPEFVARVEVVGLAGDGREEPLAQETSLFRLGGVRRVEKLRLPLPPFHGSKVRVTLVTEQGGWVDASFRFESARSFERGGRIEVPLEVTSVRHDAGATVVELVRPPGIVPDLLRVDSATRIFDRAIRVWDEGTGSVRGELGSGSVFRVDAGVPVGETRLELRPARGERLRVEIEDGDSPALEHLSFTAEIRQPALVFSLAAGEPAGVLRFGGGRARRPRYDIARLLPRDRETATGARAEAASLLLDPSVSGRASLGPTAANPYHDRTPALAFAMRAGAEVDPAAFEHRRSLRVAGAPEGLSRLRLAAPDLALAKPDLSDLRVTDGESRQWPYLVEPDAATESIALRVEGPERHGSGSRYDLVPPVAPLEPHRLVLDSDVPFFDRPFRLVVRLDDGESRTLITGRIVRPAGDQRPVGVDLPGARVRSLELLIEDGDDAPLPIRSARAEVRLPELFLTAPPGDYSLLLGDPDASAPRYELARVRDVVLAVEAAPIEAGELRDNPRFSFRSRLAGKSAGQRVLLWGVLILAVLVLGALTLRLARRESGAA